MLDMRRYATCPHLAHSLLDSFGLGGDFVHLGGGYAALPRF